jgi:hypothetical protein
MKKILAIAVIASASLVACNNDSENTEVKKDSNVIVTPTPDTNTVVLPDSTTIVAPDTTHK